MATDENMEAAKAALARKREDERLLAKAARDRVDVPPGIEVTEEAERRASRIPLLRALAAVQAEMPTIKKTETANTGKFSYRYTPLDMVWTTAQPILAKHGLVATNMMQGDTLRTFVYHIETGQCFSCGFPVNPALPPQQLGSAFTYARRYNLCAILQIVADKDDDAQDAQGAAEKAPW